MKNIISLSLLFLCAAVFAGSDPERDFVQIPAEPGFTFARDLQSRGPRGEAGEKSPIMKPYRMAKYPVTNAEYADFCKSAGHRPPRYWRNGTFPAGKEKHPVLEVWTEHKDEFKQLMTDGIPVPEQFNCCARRDKKIESYHFKELGHLIYSESAKRTYDLSEQMQKDILQLKRHHLFPETGK